MQSKWWKATVVVLVIALEHLAAGRNANADATGDTAQIEAVVKSYVTAFNKRDAQTLASHWSPEGVYTSRTSGEQVVGRDAIKDEFTSMFADSDIPNLAVATESIEFISPNVALERGTATVTKADNDVAKTRYSVVYVRRDGQWLIDRVTEDEEPAKTSQYDHLRGLEPLIGSWSYEGVDFTVDVDCRWTKNQNYISRIYKIIGRDQDGAESSGLQIIGWDPKAKEIHSWLFDSDGGLVQGVWSQRDDKWVVTSVATLADGGTGSFTTILRPLEDGNLAWQKINQVVDGQLLPNIDEIVFVRQ